MIIWHHCLGHINERKTKESVNVFGLPVANKKLPKCQSCILGKMHQLPYNSRNISSNSPLDLIFIDVWGLVPVISELKFKYLSDLLMMPQGSTRFFQLQKNWMFFTCLSLLKLKSKNN